MIKTTFWETKNWQEKADKFLWLIGAIITPAIIISITKKIYSITIILAIQEILLGLIMYSYNKWRQKK